MSNARAMITSKDAMFEGKCRRELVPSRGLSSENLQIHRNDRDGRERTATKRFRYRRPTRLFKKRKKEKRNRVGSPRNDHGISNFHRLRFCIFSRDRDDTFCILYSRKEDYNRESYYKFIIEKLIVEK